MVEDSNLLGCATALLVRLPYIPFCPDVSSFLFFYLKISVWLGFFYKFVEISLFLTYFLNLLLILIVLKM